jgi:hypothetical protein
LAATNATSVHARPTAPRGRGRTRCDRTPTASTATVTIALKSRFTCSIAACFDDTSTNVVSLQLGQSSHPSPLLVRRTAAPATITTTNAASEATAICRYRAGVTCM